MTSGEWDRDLLEGGSTEPARQGRSRRRPTMKVPPLHPAARRVLTAALVLALVGGAFAVQSYAQRAPTPPALTFQATIPDDGEGSFNDLTNPADLSQPAVVRIDLSISPIAANDPATSVVGLVGRGITSVTFNPTMHLSQFSTRSSIAVLLDCARVTLPAAATDVQAQVETTANGRSALSNVDLGAAALVWAGALTRVCSKRLGAEKLLVTKVRGTIDPSQTELDVTLSVRNDADSPGWLRIPATDDSLARVTPANLPVARGAVVDVQTHVLLRTCLSWDQVHLPKFMIETPLQLTGSIGPRASPAAEGQSSDWGFGSLTLEPAAAKTLQDLFIEACGGIGSPVLLSQQPHASFNPVTRILTSTLDLYLPPGRVRSVAFRLSTDDTYPGVNPHLDGRPVLPNVAGVATTTVTFHIPDRIDCFGAGPTLTLDITATVAQLRSPERHVPFTLFAETFLTPNDRKVVCRD